MRLTHVELRRLAMPLVAPFQASYGVETARDVLLVRVAGRTADGADTEGWGECVAMSEPRYSPEYVDGAQQVIERFLLPLLAGVDLAAADLAARLAVVRGHPMAKAALEMAVLDAELRAAGRSLAERLGAVRDRVPSGVSVGIATSVEALLDTVEGYLADGYLRVKLKIAPGWDVEPVRSVRERFGEALPLQVDANGAYTTDTAGALARLDEYGLLMIEQPLAEDDVEGHAELARRLRTPICLDETVTSARRAAELIDRGACTVVNLKPARVGGLLEAVRVHDVCVRRGVGLWCGGMFETGLGRAANVALAALPGFTSPGDLSASDRYFHRDLTRPWVLDHGHLVVPDGPGLGVDPVPAVLAGCTTAVRTVHLG